MQDGPGLEPALIGFFAAVLAALMAALFALHRERLARREQAQIGALYELQETCLAHRQAWQDFAKTQAEGVPEEVLEATVRTGQRLDLIQARIRCHALVDRVVAWRSLAKLALLQDDRRPVSTDEENRAWLDLQGAVKKDLRRFS